MCWIIIFQNQVRLFLWMDVLQIELLPRPIALEVTCLHKDVQLLDFKSLGGGVVQLHYAVGHE